MTEDPKTELPLAVLVTADGPMDGSFGGFLRSIRNSKAGMVLLGDARSDRQSSIMNAVKEADLHLSASKTSAIPENIDRIIESKEFVDELSSAIGQPLKHETEDDFVARSKTAMRHALKKRLISR